MGSFLIEEVTPHSIQPTGIIHVKTPPTIQIQNTRTLGEVFDQRKREAAPQIQENQRE